MSESQEVSIMAHGEPTEVNCSWISDVGCGGKVRLQREAGVNKARLRWPDMEKNRGSSRPAHSCTLTWVGP